MLEMTQTGFGVYSTRFFNPSTSVSPIQSQNTKRAIPRTKRHQYTKSKSILAIVRSAAKYRSPKNLAERTQ